MRPYTQNQVSHGKLNPDDFLQLSSNIVGEPAFSPFPSADLPLMRAYAHPSC
jgi:hypothetical protein